MDGNTYYASNFTAKDTLLNAIGCDSIITLNLTINPIYSMIDVQTVCDSLTWLDGITYTANNNTATQLFTSVSGCDSLVSLDLTIINSTVFTDVQQACNSYTWINGMTYTASNNTAMDTLVSSNGCDSIVSLDLTINNSKTGSDILTACDSLTWIDGITYYSNNSNASYTLTSAAGCDSVVRLFLTIRAVDVSTTTNGYTISSNATGTGVTYQWMDCSDNSLISGATNVNYKVILSGDYAVIVTDGGCIDTSDCVNFTGVGIDEGNLNSGVSLYPNPVTDIVHLTLGEHVGMVQISVLDVSGKSYLNRVSDSKNVTLDLSDFDSGVYFVKVVSNNGQKLMRLIKL
jgi:hypothetical protein